MHEENQEQIKLELSKTFENIEETKWESNGWKLLAAMKYLAKIKILIK